MLESFAAATNTKLACALQCGPGCVSAQSSRYPNFIHQWKPLSLPSSSMHRTSGRVALSGELWHIPTGPIAQAHIFVGKCLKQVLFVLFSLKGYSVQQLYRRCLSMAFSTRPEIAMVTNWSTSATEGLRSSWVGRPLSPPTSPEHAYPQQHGAQPPFQRSVLVSEQLGIRFNDIHGWKWKDWGRGGTGKNVNCSFWQVV